MNQQTKKQVATKNSTAVAAPTMDLSLVAQDAGQGLSEVNMDTIQIPFLKILSSMSPQTKKQKKLRSGIKPKKMSWVKLGFQREHTWSELTIITASL